MVLVQIQNAVSGNVLGQCDADTLPELKAWIFACLKIPVWEQRILFDGKTLSDSDCLTALGEFHVQEVHEGLGLQLLRLDSSWASALEAVHNDGNDLEQLEHLQGDRDIVTAAVKSRGAALRFAAESLRRDPQIALAAVSQDGNALRYTHLKADRQVVLAAVSNCGLSIQYAAPHLHRDIEVGATAMMEDQRALEFIPQELWIDCFEEAQRLSSQQLQCSSEFAKTFSFDTVVASLIRHLPSCFGGLAGCLVGPFVATGLALPSWAACLGTASAGVMIGARVVDASRHHVDAYLAQNIPSRAHL